MIDVIHNMCWAPLVLTELEREFKQTLMARRRTREVAARDQSFWHLVVEEPTLVRPGPFFATRAPLCKEHRFLRIVPLSSTCCGRTPQGEEPPLLWLCLGDRVRASQRALQEKREAARKAEPDGWEVSRIKSNEAAHEEPVGLEATKPTFWLFWPYHLLNH